MLSRLRLKPRKGFSSVSRSELGYNYGCRNLKSCAENPGLLQFMSCVKVEDPDSLYGLCGHKARFEQQPELSIFFLRPGAD